LIGIPNSAARLAARGIRTHAESVDHEKAYIVVNRNVVISRDDARRNAAVVSLTEKELRKSRGKPDGRRRIKLRSPVPNSLKIPFSE